MDYEATIGPEKITKNDLIIPLPEPNGTAIVVQRHENYHREPDNPHVGSLKPEAREQAYAQAESTIRQLIEQLPEDERLKFDFMIFASPTSYLGGGKRATETAQQVLAVIRGLVDEYHLSQDQVLNNQQRLPWDGGPIPSKKLVEPKMFEQSPEFVDFLRQTYGNGEMSQAAWQAYEEDFPEVRERRLELGVEGASDMGNRLAHFLSAIKRYADKYHTAHPGKRLLIWIDSHYDTISPFLREHVFNGRTDYLPVGYGAGFSMTVTPDGNAITNIGNETYSVNLSYWILVIVSLVVLSFLPEKR